MRCLYCGKRLPLLKKLTGEGDFCSEAHRQTYHEEYNRLALSRLLQAQSRPDENARARTLEPAPEPVVQAPTWHDSTRTAELLIEPVSPRNFKVYPAMAGQSDWRTGQAELPGPSPVHVEPVLAGAKAVASGKRRRFLPKASPVQGVSAPATVSAVSWNCGIAELPGTVLVLPEAELAATGAVRYPLPDLPDSPATAHLETSPAVPALPQPQSCSLRDALCIGTDAKPALAEAVVAVKHGKAGSSAVAAGLSLDISATVQSCTQAQSHTLEHVLNIAAMPEPALAEAVLAVRRGTADSPAAAAVGPLQTSAAVPGCPQAQSHTLEHVLNVVALLKPAWAEAVEVDLKALAPDSGEFMIAEYCPISINAAPEFASTLEPVWTGGLAFDPADMMPGRPAPAPAPPEKAEAVPETAAVAEIAEPPAQPVDTPASEESHEREEVTEEIQQTPVAATEAPETSVERAEDVSGEPASREPGVPEIIANWLPVDLKPAPLASKPRLMKSFQAIALLRTTPQIPSFDVLPLRPKMTFAGAGKNGSRGARKSRNGSAVAPEELPVPAFSTVEKGSAGAGAARKIARWLNISHRPADG